MHEIATISSPARLAALTAVPAALVLEMRDDRIAEFSEKAQTRKGRINRALFVLEPRVFDYVEGDSTHWERISTSPEEQRSSDGCNACRGAAGCAEERFDDAW
jgi:glucose-1-phosphate cytidylyltransferase